MYDRSRWTKRSRENSLARDPPLDRIPRALRDAANRGADALDVRTADHDAVDAVADDVARAAAVERDHRCAGGERLDHRDAEVLLGHMEEARRSRVERGQILA